MVAILAHQGGWDEMLMVAVPCAFLVWLLRLARKRTLRAGRPEAPTEPTPHEPTP